MILDKNICEDNGLTIDELFLLLCIQNNLNLQKAKQSLLEKQFISPCILQGEEITRITSKGSDKLKSIIVKSDNAYNKKEPSRFTKLAEQLREIYPKGTKPGTNYLWRGSNAEISSKLQTLSVKYNFTFTDEQAVRATQEYVNSFNGTYNYMQLLKYFILKTERDAAGNIEVKSEFMSRIENAGQEEELKKEWLDNLI